MALRVSDEARQFLRSVLGEDADDILGSLVERQLDAVVGREMRSRQKTTRGVHESLELLLHITDLDWLARFMEDQEKDTSLIRQAIDTLTQAASRELDEQGVARLRRQAEAIRRKTMSEDNEDLIGASDQEPVQAEMPLDEAEEVVAEVAETPEAVAEETGEPEPAEADDPLPGLIERALTDYTEQTAPVFDAIQRAIETQSAIIQALSERLDALQGEVTGQVEAIVRERLEDTPRASLDSLLAARANQFSAIGASRAEVPAPDPAEPVDGAARPRTGIRFIDQMMAQQHGR